MSLFLNIALVFLVYLLIGAGVWWVFDTTQRRNPYAPDGASLVLALAWPLIIWGVTLHYVRCFLKGGW